MKNRDIEKFLPTDEEMRLGYEVSKDPGFLVGVFWCLENIRVKVANQPKTQYWTNYYKHSNKVLPIGCYHTEEEAILNIQVHHAFEYVETKLMHEE